MSFFNTKVKQKLTFLKYFIQHLAYPSIKNTIYRKLILFLGEKYVISLCRDRDLDTIHCIFFA